MVLGSIYSAIVQAFIDIQNLSELLAQQPDVKDAPGALPIPLVPAHLQHQHQPIHSNNSSSDKNSSSVLDDGDIELGIVFRPFPAPISSLSLSRGNVSASKGVRIEFRDVSFHYPDQAADKGLKKVSFVVPAGTTTAIVGHTGSGTYIYPLIIISYMSCMSSHILSH